MPITEMQHYMVLSKDLEKTRAFYCDVLGLRVGPRPPFDFEGLWIYVGDIAVVHVAGQASYAADVLESALGALAELPGTDEAQLRQGLEDLRSLPRTPGAGLGWVVHKSTGVTRAPNADL